MMTVHALVSLLLAVEFTLLAGAFAWPLRKRHAKTLWPTFWLVAGFLLLRGITFACFVVSIWLQSIPMFWAAIVSAIVSALTGAVAVLLLFWHLPTIVKIPESSSIYETQLKFKATALRLANALAELPQDLPDGQEKKLLRDMLIAVLKDIQK